MMIRLTLGALLVAAAPAIAQVPTHMPMRPAEYVAVAGASDLFEQQSSQIVLETTQNPAIQAFANMMIADHATSTAAVKAAALHSKVAAPPPQLMPLQAELIAELRSASGPARDATYVAQQKAAHGQALAVQEAYAADGTAPQLRAVAVTIVPVVEHHIALLKAM